MLILAAPSSHTCAGLSERALADYCISLGKRARDAGSLASQLEEQGLPSGSATRQFAADLLARLPRGGGGGGAAAAAAAQKQREAEAAAFARKQQQYSLLLDEDDAEEEQRRRQQQEAQRQRQQQQDGGGGRDGKDGGKKHLRRSKQELEGDDETVVKKRSRKRAWEEEEGGWLVQGCAGGRQAGVWAPLLRLIGGCWSAAASVVQQMNCSCCCSDGACPVAVFTAVRCLLHAACKPARSATAMSRQARAVAAAQQCCCCSSSLHVLPALKLNARAAIFLLPQRTQRQQRRGGQQMSGSGIGWRRRSLSSGCGSGTR